MRCADVAAAPHFIACAWHTLPAVDPPFLQWIRDDFLDNAHSFAEAGTLTALARNPMAHTNIDLDEALTAEAMRLTGVNTKKEVGHLGLRELIRLARLQGVREHRGKFHWQGDLEKMRVEEIRGLGRFFRRYKRSH